MPYDAKSGLYHYRESGLDNIWLQSGFELVNTPYGEGVRFHDLDGLHTTVSEHLVLKPKRLTGAECKFLRVELDLSRDQLALECLVSPAHIRAAEIGVVPVETSFDQALRRVYQERKSGSELEPLSKLNNSPEVASCKSMKLQVSLIRRLCETYPRCQRPDSRYADDPFQHELDRAA